jgi:hypothetical protein
MRLAAISQTPGERAKIITANRAVRLSLHLSVSRQITRGMNITSKGLTNQGALKRSPMANKAGQPGGNGE